MTVVEPVAGGEEFARLAGLLQALGFEAGKGWSDGEGTGAAFLAPLGNLELVTGRKPAVPRILVEVTQLDHVHGAVMQWAGAAGGDTGLRGRGYALEFAHVHAAGRGGSRLLAVRKSASRRGSGGRRRAFRCRDEVRGDYDALEYGHHRPPAAGRARLPAPQRRGDGGYRGSARARRLGDSQRGADHRQPDKTRTKSTRS